MGGNEIDTGVGSPSGGFIEVGAAGEAIRNLAEGLILAAPVVTHAIPIFSVPLQPQRRKLSHLITALADIPGFCDEFHLADHRILLDDVEESREAIHVVKLPRQ